MDAAQIISSVAMGGAGGTSSFEVAADSSASPLFGQMFASAVSSAEIATTGNGGTSLSGMVVMSEKIASERGEVVTTDQRDMEAEQDVMVETALRRLAEENAGISARRLLSLLNGRENEGVLKNPLVLDDGGMDTLPDQSIVNERVSAETPLEGENVAQAGEDSPEIKISGAKDALPFEGSPLLAATVAVQVSEGKSGGINLPGTASSTARSAVDSTARGTGAAGTERLPGPTESLVKDPGFNRRILNNGVSAETPLVGVEIAQVGEDSPVSKVFGDMDLPESASSTARSAVESTARGTGAAGTERLSGPTENVVKDATVPVKSENVFSTDGKGFTGKNSNGEEVMKVVRQESTSSSHQIKPEVTGETVSRELSDGMTARDSGRTSTAALYGAASEATAVSGRSAARERVSLSPRETAEGITLMGKDEKPVLKNEGFSSQDGSLSNSDSRASEKGGETFETKVSSESFDTVIRDRVETVSGSTSEKEASSLRESVLSQVKDKLAGYEPANKGDKITLKLNPRELGELRIEVRLVDQKMSVDITTQHSSVKEVLLQNIDQLKDTLSRQNISVERFDVSGGAAQGHSFNQSFREGGTAGNSSGAPSYGFSTGYSGEDSAMSSFSSYGDSREDSLVDVRF